MKNVKCASCTSGNWLLQILAIIGSISSIAAIGILLAHYNNKSVLDWKGVTLNAIVSVLSKFSGAMLAFTLSDCLGQAKWIWLSWKQRPLNDLNLIDQGSRGPLGSLRLLAHPTARSLVGMGAIIVILSVASDPFVQLTLGRREDLQFTNDSSVQIARAKRYSKGSFESIAATTLVSPDGNNYTATETDADFGMKSAVFYGLSQSSPVITQQSQRSCPSGNCTWNVFPSLAVCSACNDLTDQVKKKDLGITDPLVVSLDPLNPGSVIGDVTGYFLPNGLNGDDTILMTAYGTGNATQTVSFSSHDTLIWSMTIMNFTLNQNSLVSSTSSFNTSTNVSATECGLWYCVNNYNSTVKGGNLTEVTEPAPSQRDPGSWQPIPGTWNGNAIPPDTLNYNNLDSASAQRTDLRLGEGFNLSQTAIYSISGLMNTTFVTNQGGDGINAYVLQPDKKTLYIPTAMQSLYNSQNLTGTFAALAQSMTNNLRQNDDNNTISTGQLGTNVVLIQVRGWFLALPVTLIAGGAVLLAIVFYHTRKSKLEVWGTNVLPVVALGEKIGRVLDDHDLSAHRMEEVAEHRLVQFPALKQRPAFSRFGTSRGRGSYEMVEPLGYHAKQSP